MGPFCFLFKQLVLQIKPLELKMWVDIDAIMNVTISYTSGSRANDGGFARAVLWAERIFTSRTSKENVRVLLERNGRDELLTIARKNDGKTREVDMSLSQLLREGTLSGPATTLANELKRILTDEMAARNIGLGYRLNK
jgi:hypothetical protein